MNKESNKKSIKIYLETIYNCSKPSDSTACKFFEAEDNNKKECKWFEKDTETCSSIQAWFNDAMSTIYTINKLNELESEMLRNKIDEINNIKYPPAKKTITKGKKKNG